MLNFYVRYISFQEATMDLQSPISPFPRIPVFVQSSLVFRSLCDFLCFPLAVSLVGPWEKTKHVSIGKKQRRDINVGFYFSF